MRILVISNLFPHHDNMNSGIFVARHLTELQRQGEELKIYVPAIWAPTAIRMLRKKWRVHDHTRRLCACGGLDIQTVPFKRLPGKWFYRWDGLSIYLAMKRDVVRAHRANPFDVIYGISWMQDCDAAVRLARLLRIPAVGYAIGSDINTYPHYSKTLYRHFVRISRALDATQAMGQAVADKIDAVCGKRTLEVAGVVDLETFTPVLDKAAVRQELGFPKDQLVVLFVGHLLAGKGIFELVEVTSRIRHAIPHMLVRICGDGQDEVKLRAAIRNRHVQGIIELVGPVPPDEMHKWMQASDLLVLPSHTEGMPNVVMEAMACGLPVVATQVGGLPAVLGDCDGAILIPPGDTDALEDALLRALRDSDLRRRMGRTARKKAEERFGVAPNARRIINYLASTVERYRRDTCHASTP